MDGSTKNIREIIFDTETTGFNANGDDRITEIGALEIIDLLPTGRQFHCYLDPLRDVPDKVVEITGLTTEFLRGKPLFKDKADQRYVGHGACQIPRLSRFARCFV